MCVGVPTCTAFYPHFLLLFAEKNSSFMLAQGVVIFKLFEFVISCGFDEK